MPQISSVPGTAHRVRAARRIGARSTPRPRNSSAARSTSMSCLSRIAPNATITRRTSHSRTTRGRSSGDPSRGSGSSGSGAESSEPMGTSRIGMLPTGRRDELGDRPRANQRRLGDAASSTYRAKESVGDCPVEKEHRGGNSDRGRDRRVQIVVGEVQQHDGEDREPRDDPDDVTAEAWVDPGIALAPALRTIQAITANVRWIPSPPVGSTWLVMTAAASRASASTTGTIAADGIRLRPRRVRGCLPAARHP